MGGTTELFDAIRAGDMARVRALVEADRALASARNERGHSAVLIAQYHRQPEVVAALLDAGAELDVFDAASVGKTERVQALVERDPTLVGAWSSDGFTPLHLASFFGYPEITRYLIARGADVNAVARNPMRVQPLHSAVTRGLEIARQLVEAGAAVNAKQQEGWAPLHEAVNRGDVELVRYLLAHGADPKQQNDAGKSAIGIAAEKNNAEMLKVLKGWGDRA